MAIDWLADCRFTGPALPEPFVRFDLEAELRKAKLLPTSDASGSAAFEFSRRKLAELGRTGGPQRVFSHVVAPLLEPLGYARVEPGGEVATSQEPNESGGEILLSADGGARLRVWAFECGDRLDAPTQRGRAYRYSPLRVAARVLRARGERLGLLTNGEEIRLLVTDPARPDSEITLSLDAWRLRRREPPPSFRLLLALGSPDGVAGLPNLIDKARLKQTKVTKDLRDQAKSAIAEFLQAVLDDPRNAAALAPLRVEPHDLARRLWREGLIVVYRLLFILKLESSDDPARAFTFASGRLWRRCYSPTEALAPVARRFIEDRAHTGGFLEAGLRGLFALFERGLDCNELTVRPLGGVLFGAESTPLLAQLAIPERGAAALLYHLLWTPTARGGRQRVHYGPLDVEDLGRVYEALLELEPGIATEPMCRLQRAKLQVVVPLAQGDRYRPVEAATQTAPAADSAEDADSGGDDADEDVAADEADEEAAPKGGKTQVVWIEEIPAGRFFLRVGLGRKSSGSYYTPHSFVRFLVQETLGPKVETVSPADVPEPAAILRLKVLDPAIGSGHFLVEACRFLGAKLYEACRACDERAATAEARCESEPVPEARTEAVAEAAQWRAKLDALPDPDGELARYLPSRNVDGVTGAFPQQKAEAICRRLVAVHCLYGVDKNPLAVELAKLAVWFESHAEGLPLTFLDHRFVLGDSLTGPFVEHLFTLPISREPLREGLGEGALTKALSARLSEALAHVRDLEKKLDLDVADLAHKAAARERLNKALAPFRTLAAGWSGLVMDGGERGDEAYRRLVSHVLGAVSPAEFQPGAGGRAQGSALDDVVRRGVALGLGLVPEPPIDLDALLEGVGPSDAVPALGYDLTFPEVFHPAGDVGTRYGFDVVLGNPPWDRMLPADKDFFAAYDFSILAAPTKAERTATERRLKVDPNVATAHAAYKIGFRHGENALDRLYSFQVVEIDGDKTIGKQDAFRAFMERDTQLLGDGGSTGVVVPSAFHANEGATGVRRLYFEHLALQTCFSFENRRKLFEIDSRFKFAVVVATRPGPTTRFACQFYLHDDGWLFGDRSARPPLSYDLEFIRKTGGEYLSLLELRSEKDLEVAKVCFKNGEPFRGTCKRLGIQLGRELNMTDDAWRFTPVAEVLPNGEDPRDPEVSHALIARGYLVLHEGKTFHQFTDRWGDRPRYVVANGRISDRQELLLPARFFRLSFRDIASATNERTAIFCLIPPGTLFGNKAPCNRSPASAPTWVSFALASVGNSFTFDAMLRLSVQSTVNFFILNRTPTIALNANFVQTQFLVHNALRLSADRAFAPLWREQLNGIWREPTPPFTWPVLATDDARWRVRAAIDATVADAYGLTRAQYEHVLSTFSHTSYRAAPGFCLAAFDELKMLGLDAFTKKHDPYHDIPLNTALPKPVIDIPMPAATATTVEGDKAADGAPKKRRNRKKPGATIEDADSSPHLPFDSSEPSA